MYSYEFKSKAFKQLRKLDKSVQRKIIEKLDQVSREEVLFSNKRLTHLKLVHLDFGSEIIDWFMILTEG